MMQPDDSTRPESSNSASSAAALQGGRCAPAGRPPLVPARKRLFMASLLFAFLFPYVTWEQAAGCALLLLLFNILILPWLGIDVSKCQDVIREFGVTDSGISLPPPSPLLNKGGRIILYPTSVLALILLYRNYLHVAAAAWAIMALGDGMATVVGQFVAGHQTQKTTAEMLRSAQHDRLQWQGKIAATLPWNRRKTWAGSLSFVVAATVGAYVLARWTAYEIPAEWTLMVCAAAAVLGAVTESFPIGVDDNITVPLVVGAFMFCAFLVQRSALDRNLPYLGRRVVLAIGVNLAFALLAYGLRAASRSGAICGFLLGVAIYLGYGFKSFLLLFAFVLLGTVATRVGFARKVVRGVAERRGGVRSSSQALANLVVAALFAILVITTHHEGAFLIALVATLAEAAGDTVSSEIGQWASDRAYLITTLKSVPAGADGGISLTGTTAGFAASAIIVALGVGLRALWGRIGSPDPPSR